MTKRSKNSDAVMTGILVTRFKMGLIDVEGLELMAANTTREERCFCGEKGARRVEGDCLKFSDERAGHVCFTT